MTTPDRRQAAPRRGPIEVDASYASGGPLDRWRRPLVELTAADLYEALRRGWSLDDAVPRVIELLEADPLLSAGWHAGDLLLALTEVEARFWGRHPRMYARYREVLRAGALARRGLPIERRLDFWLGRPDR